MNKHRVRLGATICFDKHKEKDLIDQVEQLASARKLGDFIADALRVVLENPELMEKKGMRIGKYGLTGGREEYFSKIREDMDILSSKVDKIYEMALKAYTLGAFGKRMGISGKSENTMMAGFILERHIEETCSALGINRFNHIYESDKLGDAKDRANEILEYIIESYDGITDEIVKNVSVGRIQEVKETARVDSRESIDTIKGRQIDNRGIPYEEVKSSHKVYSEPLNNSKGNAGENLGYTEEEGDDDIIDFGNDANWDALMEFTGGG